MVAVAELVTGVTCEKRHAPSQGPTVGRGLGAQDRPRGGLHLISSNPGLSSSLCIFTGKRGKSSGACQGLKPFDHFHSVPFEPTISNSYIVLFQIHNLQVQGNDRHQSTRAFRPGGSSERTAHRADCLIRAPDCRILVSGCLASVPDFLT